MPMIFLAYTKIMGIINMEFSNETYDRMKWWAQIGLPALATFVAGVVSLLHVPNGAVVVGIITLLDGFLGDILKRSSDAYNDGELIVDTTDPLKDIYSISLPDYPTQLAEKDKVILKVSRPAHMARTFEEE